MNVAYPLEGILCYECMKMLSEMPPWMASSPVATTPSERHSTTWLLHGDFTGAMETLGLGQHPTVRLAPPAVQVHGHWRFAVAMPLESYCSHAPTRKDLASYILFCTFYRFHPFYFSKIVVDACLAMLLQICRPGISRLNLSTRSKATEHFLHGSGQHPHPDPIYRAAPSPPNATSSCSTTQPRAVQRQSRWPSMNTSPWILLPTIEFNFY
ncbi:hypothetical protein ACQJBY_027256 [Aegilops geniculata]